VQAPESAPDLSDRLLVQLRVGYFENDVIEKSFENAGLVDRRRKIATDRRIGCKKEIVVGAMRRCKFSFTGIFELLFMLVYAVELRMWHA